MKIVIAILMLTALMLPSVVQAQTVGIRDNPLLIGTSADISKNWQITVLNVYPNATDEMVYGKSTGVTFVRDPGTELFFAKIQAKYTGTGSSFFDSSDLSVVGPSSVGYTALGIEANSRIPDYSPNSREVFTVGVIIGIVLWMVPPVDANHLVMYDRTIPIDRRIYIALF